MHGKCGSIDKANRVFEGMKLRDVYTYTAMIVGLAIHGQGEGALEVFTETLKTGIEPNEVTYIGVLMACSHAGLVKEGLKHITNMSTLRVLKLQQEHYGCMVDLLGCAGARPLPLPSVLSPDVGRVNGINSAEIEKNVAQHYKSFELFSANA
ncbi:hypothetical protein LguiA_010577 [Lonicera macranthoides]